MFIRFSSVNLCILHSANLYILLINPDYSLHLPWATLKLNFLMNQTWIRYNYSNVLCMLWFKSLETEATNSSSFPLVCWLVSGQRVVVCSMLEFNSLNFWKHSVYWNKIHWNVLWIQWQLETNLKKIVSDGYLFH